jgi:acyl-CoA thioester hydrolase
MQQVVVGSMPYRVAMADVDAYGIMYYANFFILFERGRTELLRAIGIDYGRVFRQKQVLTPVVEAACRYMAPVVYDDLITIETAITKVENKGMRFDYRVLREDTPLAVGFTQHVFIDPQGRPVNYGKEVMESLKSKGLVKKADEDVEQKLKNLVKERIEGEKPN